MKTILRVSFSPRGEGAESHLLSQKIIAHLLETVPGAEVIDRDLGRGSVMHVDEGYAVSQGGPLDVANEGTMARSEELIAELQSADFLVIATPMHNLTIPSALKAWIDHVVRVRKTFDLTAAGKIGTLRDRPVFIAIASGGRFSGPKPNQPDFLTDYLRVILEMIGLKNVTFFSVQGTGSRAEPLSDSRARTDHEMEAFFASFQP